MCSGFWIREAPGGDGMVHVNPSDLAFGEKTGQFDGSLKRRKDMFWRKSGETSHPSAKGPGLNQNGGGQKPLLTPGSKCLYNCILWFRRFRRQGMERKTETKLRTRFSVFEKTREDGRRFHDTPPPLFQLIERARAFRGCRRGLSFSFWF